MPKTPPPKPQPIPAERTSFGSQFGPLAFSSLKKFLFWGGACWGVCTIHMSACVRDELAFLEKYKWDGLVLGSYI